MPIDMTALSYHWSVLKIVRRTFFFSGRARVLSGLGRESDFLTLVDAEVVFFAILITRFIPTSMLHLSRCGVRVTGGLETGQLARAVLSLKYSFFCQWLVKMGAAPALAQRCHDARASEFWHEFAIQSQKSR
jgi:hypothetical protein